MTDPRHALLCGLTHSAGSQQCAMADDQARFPPPTPTDWLVLAINIAFVATGIIILPSSPDVGIVTLAFFGSCLVVSAGTVLRKFRFRRFASNQVRVLGGVPIRSKDSRMLILGGWLLVLGVLLVLFGHNYPALFRALSGCVAIVGCVLMAGVLAGWWRSFLQFDPGHLTIGQRGWLVRVPWDEIVAVQETDMHSNPALFIAVSDPARLIVEPPDAAGRAMKAMARNQSMCGAEFMIMTANFGIDLPVLSEAISRYASTASARSELGTPLTNA